MGRAGWRCLSWLAFAMVSVFMITICDAQSESDYYMYYFDYANGDSNESNNNTDSASDQDVNSVGAAVWSATGPCTVSEDGSCFRSPNYPNNTYNTNDYCIITAEQTAVLRVTEFATEEVYDALTVNGNAYSGFSGPEGEVVLAGATITFSSDESFTLTGFEICAVSSLEMDYDDDSDVEDSDSDSDGFSGGAAVQLVSGPCTVSEDGCFRSPNYPEDYGISQGCSFTIMQPVALSVMTFETELDYDILRVNGEEYSGSVGPHMLVAEAGTEISWYSDASVTASGFEICASISSPVRLGSGPCTVSPNGCFRSPNYPGNYGTDQNCDFTVEQTAVLSVNNFETEADYDVLTVNGVPYSGVLGPNRLVVAGSDGEPGLITWASDSSVTKVGFEICTSILEGDSLGPRCRPDNVTFVRSAAAEAFLTQLEDPTVSVITVTEDLELDLSEPVIIDRALQINGACAEGAGAGCVRALSLAPPACSARFMDFNSAFLAFHAGANVTLRNFRIIAHATLSAEEGARAAFHSCTFEGTPHGCNGISITQAALNVVQLNGGEATFENCVFNQTCAQNDGGTVVALHQSTARFEACDFAQTRAVYKGGTIYAVGSDISLDRCSFSQTFAGDMGGAIYALDSEISLEGCSFSQSEAVNHGGALYAFDSDVSLKQCTFNATEAGAQGGAIHVRSSGDGIAIPAVPAATPHPASVEECSFSHSHAEDGGAIYSFDTDMNVKKSNFSQTESSWNGGAMHVQKAEISLEGCKFTETDAGGYGGSLHANEAEYTVRECSFSKTTAKHKGGAIHAAYASEFRVYNCSFEDTEVIGNGAGGSSGNGGAINTFFDYYMLLEDCSFSRSKAAGKGGTIYVEDADALFLKRCSFNQSEAGAQGGTIYGMMSKDTHIDNCTFTHSEAGWAGGAMFFIDSTLNMTESSSAHTQAGLRNPEEGNGGMLMSINSLVTSTNCTFDRSSSTQNGGVMYFAKGETLATNTHSVRGCTITGASASNLGGGVWLGQGQNMNLTESTFQGASALSGGGMFIQQGSNWTVNSVRFSDNRASGSGGAIFCLDCETMDLRAASFLNNRATTGGAIYASDLVDSVIIYDTTFLSNAALGKGARGGAFLLEQMEQKEEQQSNTSTIQFRNVDFNGNLLDTVESSELLFESGVNFDANSLVATCGGAISVISSSQQHTALELDDVRFDDNQGIKGGGLCVAGENLSMRMAGAAFSRNRARFGGGIYAHSLSGGDLAILNSTFQEDGWVPSTMASTGLDLAEYTQGGAVALMAMAPEQVRMSGVSFENTYSSNGEAVFMEDQSSPFECNSCTPGQTAQHNQEQCIHHNRPPPLIGGPMRQLVPSVATPTPKEVTAASDLLGAIHGVGNGQKLGLHLLALDLLGTPLCEFAKVKVLVSVQGANTSVLLDNRPTLEAVFEQGRADFSSVVVTGTLGHNATLMFEVPELNVTAQIGMTVARCNDLEYELDGFCRSCDEGQLVVKGDDGVNSGCISCEDNKGIRCNGGLSVEVAQGFWLANETVLCNSGDCILARVYGCEEETACNFGSNITDTAATNGSYSFTDALMVSLEGNSMSPDQCATGYRSDVVQCAKCVAGYYSERAEGGNGVCKKCTGGAAKAWAQFFGVLVFTLLVVAALFFSFIMAIRSIGCEMLLARQIQYMDQYYNAKAMQQTAVGLWTITIGSLQVLGMLYGLFAKRIPPFMSNFLSAFGSISLNFITMMNIPCLAYSLGMDTDAASSFYASLVTKACIPLVILVLYLAGRQICKKRMKRHAGNPEMVKLYGEYLAGVTILCVFLVTLLHPSISATMFEVYRCEQVYFDADSVASGIAPPYWNSNDKSIECFVGEYWFFAGLSVAMILLFTLGWPVSVFLYLKHHHDLSVVKLVERPGKSEEAAALRAQVLLWNRVSTASERGADAAPASVRDEDILLFSKAVCKAEPCRDAPTGAPDAPATHRAWLRVRAFKWWEFLAYAIKLVPPRAGDLWVQLEVEPLLKTEVTNGNAVVKVPVNVFDSDPQLGLYAKPFIRLFEDRYYYWGPVEMLRKLLQTSFIVVIRIIDDRFDLMFATLLSFLYLSVQGHLSPHKDDLDDKLSVIFLVNEFLVLLSLIGVTYVEGWDDSANGISMLVVQGFIAVYVCYLIWTCHAMSLYHDFKSMYTGASKRVMKVYSNTISRKRSMTSSRSTSTKDIDLTLSVSTDEGEDEKGHSNPEDAMEQGASLAHQEHDYSIAPTKVECTM